MKIADVKKLTPLERFIYWVRERESIRLKKEAGEPPPWTDDEILQRYRFCNVRRMDDKVSQWLLKNWYEPYFDHPNMLVAVVMARHFNLPSALEAVGFPVRWRPDYIKATLRGIKAKGGRIFNGAYMVRGIGEVDKTEMVVTKVCQPLVNNPPKLDPDSLKNSWEALLPCWGLSSFMAGQVVADLRWAITGKWADASVWAPLGPGSKRGMNRLHERPPKQPLSQEQFLEELLALKEQVNKRTPAIAKRLELGDLQSVCCEGDKYVRALLGEGKPKQLYRIAT